MAINMSFSLI